MSNFEYIALDHVEITVPEPDKASEYYQRVFGLKEMGTTGDSICLSCQPNNSTISSAGELIVREGPASFKKIAFSSEDKSKLDTIQTPSNHEFEICYPTERVDRGQVKTPFSITKLGHVTFKDPNPTQLQEFYRNNLGFKLSDRLGERFYWLRFNQEHHNVGVSFARNPGAHHIAYELENWEAVKNLCDHFLSQDVQVEFGPGRHGPGNNIFIYVLDPYGIRFEFFTELAFIENEMTHEPKDWVGGRLKNANTWGPKPPESFINEE